ncbi:DUF2141 domain-containing protein [Membranicola marinus]|uniref:DUF2141 domain-containing protein n=1 Tax=Membranihabitans marinus TaxID=1227546 RepID=A0A953HWE8_9BACT|nr:DUF2141 domain-containing protein [Membranihabitans marinus]MBY5957796.1 DUF2141 domain-containing protein [Membranihabitans marinus]
MMTLFSYWYLFLITTLTSPPTSSIDLTIQNIKTGAGSIKIALYNAPTDFPKQTKAYKVGEVSAQKPQVSYSFENIPAGDYAIALYHDVNADDELNFKMFFIPKEPYGFSNNFVPKFSKPGFDDAKFQVKNDTEINIKLIH